ncbi:MAG: hypothetical protein IIX50_02110, partial [Bacteroidaceae bacterium]|nr:hypothetical protein [Bacteroidaceae bacterium]
YFLQTDQTFQELFSRFFNEISQYADFQRESWEGIFRKDREIGIYMLQNMVFWRILGDSELRGSFAFVRNYFCMVGEKIGQP